MVENGEALLESSDLPRKDRTRIEKIVLSLVLAVEQLEWVLGIRTGTAMDDYTWSESLVN